MQFPPAVQNVIDIFKRLPGIGPKAAERLVFALLKRSPSQVLGFAKALENLIRDVKYCHFCNNIAQTNPCSICKDANRNKQQVCVVSKPQDLMAIESTGLYKGHYHVLWGELSAIEGVTPDKIKIKELLAKIKQNQFSEVILAFNMNIEGESTILYLQETLKHYPHIKVSRLAKGLPMGSELEYADEITLSNALSGRIKL